MFLLFQAIFYIIYILTEKHYSEISKTQPINKFSFYISSIIFFSLIPATAILYLNEFSAEKYDLESKKLEGEIAEIRYIRNNWSRVRGKLSEFQNQYFNFVFSGDQNKFYAIDTFDQSFLDGITQFAKFSLARTTKTSKSVNRIERTKIPTIYSLLESPSHPNTFDTINGNLSALRAELTVLSNDWSYISQEKTKERIEIDVKKGDSNTKTVFLIILLGFLDIIGSIFAIFYIVPRNTPTENSL
tara:strand:+ start:1278 stop:2009 length:732 start_codon:yes stop_codon:yes gene_type:complete